MHCKECGYPFAKGDEVCSQCGTPRERLEIDWNLSNYPEPGKVEDLEFDWKTGEFTEHKEDEELGESKEIKLPETEVPRGQIPEISKIPEQQINPADLGIPFITREEREAQEGGFSLDTEVEVEPKEAPVTPEILAVESGMPSIPQIPEEPVTPVVPKVPVEPEILAVESAIPSIPAIPEEPPGSLDSLDKFFEYDKASDEFQRLLEAQQNRVEEFDTVVKPQIEPTSAIPFIDSFKIEEEETEKEDEPEVIWLGKMEDLKAEEAPVIEIKAVEEAVVEFKPVEPEIEAGSVTESEPEFRPESEPELGPESEPELGPESEPELGSEPEPELEVEPVVAPEIEIIPVEVPIIELKAVEDAVAEFKPVEPEIEAGPVTEAEPEEEVPLVWMEAIEALEEEKPKKTGVGEAILAFVTIVLILIGLFFGAIIGIQHYKPGTEAAAKAGQIQESVVSVLVQAKDKIESWFAPKEEADGGDEAEEPDGNDMNGAEDRTDDPDGDAEDLDDTEGTLMEKLINSTSNLNENIKIVAANDELVWKEGKNYGKASIADSKPVESEEDQEKVVAGLVEFNSKWIDYINNKNKDVIGLTKAGSQARKNVETFSKVGKVKQEFLRMEIGEIRAGGKEYYAWIYEEISEEKDGKTQKNIYNYVYSLEKINNKMLITNYYKY